MKEVVGIFLVFMVFAALSVGNNHANTQWSDINRSVMNVQSDYAWSIGSGDEARQLFLQRRVTCYLNALAFFNEDHKSLIDNFRYWNKDYRKPCVDNFKI